MVTADRCQLTIWVAQRAMVRPSRACQIVCVGVWVHVGYRVRFSRLGKWISSWFRAVFQPWAPVPRFPLRLLVMFFGGEAQQLES